MHIISNILIITTGLVALAVTGCRRIEDRVGYVRADVYSVPFSIQHVTAEQPSMIPHRSNAEHVEIGDAGALEELRERVGTARLIKRNTYLDSRISKSNCGKPIQGRRVIVAAV